MIVSVDNWCLVSCGACMCYMQVLSVLLDTLLWLLLWRQRQTGFWFQNGHQREDGKMFCATNWHRYDLGSTHWRGRYCCTFCSHLHQCMDSFAWLMKSFKHYLDQQQAFSLEVRTMMGSSIVIIMFDSSFSVFLITYWIPVICSP